MLNPDKFIKETLLFLVLLLTSTAFLGIVNSLLTSSILFFLLIVPLGAAYFVLTKNLLNLVAKEL